MRVPAKQALQHASVSRPGGSNASLWLALHGEVVGVELLLVAQSLKVGLDSQRHNGRRAVGQVLLERFGLYRGRHGGCGGCGGMMGSEGCRRFMDGPGRRGS
jgi:hypothetical protein